MKMSLKNPQTLRKCEENLQSQMPELQFLKWYCTPEKIYNFFSQLKSLQKYDF